MGSMLYRRDRLDRIEVRIGHLGEQATKLHEHEQELWGKLEELRAVTQDPGGRLRSARQARTLGRRKRRLAQLQAKRKLLVEREIRSIMLALQEQSRRTRERLDHELERLAPVEAEWERLRSMFDTLELAVASPALEQLAGHWRGVLEIPEFPVREGEGYAKPFPHRALLF